LLSFIIYTILFCGYKQGKKAKEIVQEIQKVIYSSYKFIEGKRKQDAILTLCATGFGAAKKI